MKDFLLPFSLIPDSIRVCQGQYDIDIQMDSPVILDIGACIGSFCMWAAARWPKATIHAFEPIEECYDLLVSNTKELNVKTYRCAVRDTKEKSLLMRLGKNNVGESSFYDLWEQESKASRRVAILRPWDLPAADIVKIDTEGCELEIIKALNLTPVKAIVAEIHRAEDLREIRDFLSDFEMISVFSGQTGRWIVKYKRR